MSPQPAAQSDARSVAVIAVFGILLVNAGAAFLAWRATQDRTAFFVASIMVSIAAILVDIAAIRMAVTARRKRRRAARRLQAQAERRAEGSSVQNATGS